MHPKTEALLRACARAKWSNTVGPVAAAVNEWQEAGRPDMPEPEKPARVLVELAEGVEILASMAEGLTPKDIKSQLSSLVSEAKWRLRDETQEEDHG